MVETALEATGGFVCRSLTDIFRKSRSSLVCHAAGRLSCNSIPPLMTNAGLLSPFMTKSIAVSLDEHKNLGARKTSHFENIGASHASVWKMN
jgi:hypothetical protein